MVKINQLTCRQSYQKGQVAVEYILLVALSVSVAVLVASQFVSRNPEAPGVITSKWRQIIERIASDNTAEVGN